MEPGGFNSKDIMANWLKIKPFVEKALPYSMDSAVKSFHIRNELVAGKLQCWYVGHKGRILVVLLTRVDKLDSGETNVLVYLLAGKNLKETFPLFAHIRAWAQSLGAKTITGFTRPAIARMVRPMGFKQIGVDPNGQIHISMEV